MAESHITQLSCLDCEANRCVDYVVLKNHATIGGRGELWNVFIDILGDREGSS